MHYHNGVEATNNFTRRLVQIFFAVLAITIVIGGYALYQTHNLANDPNHCKDNGIVGYCCQKQQQKLTNVGRNPDYLCPG